MTPIQKGLPSVQASDMLILKKKFRVSTFTKYVEWFKYDANALSMIQWLLILQRVDQKKNEKQFTAFEIDSFKIPISRLLHKNKQPT